MGTDKEERAAPLWSALAQRRSPYAFIGSRHPTPGLWAQIRAIRLTLLDTEFTEEGAECTEKEVKAVTAKTPKAPRSVIQSR